MMVAMESPVTWFGAGKASLAQTCGVRVMSSINGLGPNSPINKIIQQPVQKQAPVNPPAQLPSVDKLELSGVSHLLAALKTNDIRVDKVQQIRSQIQAGTYETEDKLDIAADRLLDELGK